MRKALNRNIICAFAIDIAIHLIGGLVLKRVIASNDVLRNFFYHIGQISNPNIYMDCGNTLYFRIVMA